MFWHYLSPLSVCRAKKIPVAEKEKKQGKKSTKGGDSSEPEKEKDKDGDKTDGGEPGSPVAKKKRKIRLDMHLEQIFLDSQDAYVWLYDPIPWYYWLGGSAIVLGIIAGE